MPEPASPWVAAGLSFVFPGLGQVYAHEFLKGVLMLAIGIGLSFFVFPIGALAFIILLLGAPWPPIAWFLVGIPDIAAVPLILIAVFILAPGTWLFWFYSSVRAYEGAERYNEHVATAPCRTCGEMMPARAAECPRCGAPAE